MFTGIAKLMPSVPSVCASTAVLMPINSPSVLISAPPELPKLMAASVWMKSSKSVTPSRPRPVALTMPWVTGLTEPERIADREHHITRAQHIRAAHRHDRRVLQIHAQDREIGIRIGADDGGRGDTTVRQLHADLVRALDHVMVGDQVAVGVEDDARAEAAFHALPDLGGILSQQRIAGGARPAGWRPRGRVNVNYSRSGAADRIGERPARVALARRKRHGRSRGFLRGGRGGRAGLRGPDQQQDGGNGEAHQGPFQQEQQGLRHGGHGWRLE